MSDELFQQVLKRFRLPPAVGDEPLMRAGAEDVLTALAHFAELLPADERPTDALELLEFAASTNAFEPLRLERGLPATVVFYAAVHPAYFTGEGRIGGAAWRLCYTDGGAVGPSPVRERLLDEVIRLAEAMHDKNPFGEVPFDGGKTVILQEGARFQAMTALYGDAGMASFNLAKGGIRYYASGGSGLAQDWQATVARPASAAVDAEEKRAALRRWAASSALAGVLAHAYIGGPDMRMGEEEMAWVDAAAAEIGAARRMRQHPAVTGLAAAAGGFPHQAWELTGRTVAASLKEALRHPGMTRYGLPPAGYPARPIRVLIQGFGDVGGSVARLLTEESPDQGAGAEHGGGAFWPRSGQRRGVVTPADGGRREQGAGRGDARGDALAFRIAGVADELGAIYRTEGLDAAELLRLRQLRRPIVEYTAPLDALWVAAPSEADRARPEFRGTDSRELILQEADVFIPAAIPNVIDDSVARRLRVRLVAEGANNAVAPRTEEILHEQEVLYLPGQALNWGGVKGSTLEALFRELTKRTLPFVQVEERVREALAPFGPAVDAGWAVELLRSGLSGPPLVLETGEDLRRAFAVAVLEDLARSNIRWLMNDLVASRYERPPLERMRALARTIRARKVQLLSLIELGLGAEFFAPATTLARQKSLLDDRLKELLSDTGHGGLTATQVVEQRQMLQQLQNDVGNGLSPVFASLLAALDLARQKVMDPDGYSQESLRRDLAILQAHDGSGADASQGVRALDLSRLEDSLYRLQRVHPGANRAEFVRALAGLLRARELSPIARRNAALALAKLGSADAGPCAALLDGLSDPDLSVRATCRWALDQMAIAAAVDR
jgi:glutamate dehydrogenase/leucine dehydrogenase